MSADAVELFVRYGSTGRPPQPWMFNEGVPEGSWRAELAVHKRLTQSASEALNQVSDAWLTALSESGHQGPNLKRRLARGPSERRQEGPDAAETGSYGHAARYSPTAPINTPMVAPRPHRRPHQHLSVGSPAVLSHRELDPQLSRGITAPRLNPCSSLPLAPRTTLDRGFRVSSQAQPLVTTHHVDPAYEVSTGIGLVSLADVRQCVRIA